MEHAKLIAEKIACAASESIPEIVYCSPFLRTTHTASILAERLGKDTPSLCVEEGLYEWLTPSLLVTPDGVRTKPRTVEQLQAIFPFTIDTTYQSYNPVLESITENTSGEDFTSPFFPESEETLLKRCATTLKGILNASQGKNIAIVSHAPCDQALAFAMETDASSPSESKLVPWPLGGITMFSRELIETDPDHGVWKMEIYGDTCHMPGIYKCGIKEWSLPCFTK